MNGTPDPTIVTPWAASRSGVLAGSNTSAVTSELPQRSAVTRWASPPMWAIGASIATRSTAVTASASLNVVEAASSARPVCRAPLGAEVVPEV